MQVDTLPIFAPLLQSDLKLLGQPELFGTFRVNLGYNEQHWAIGATDRYLLYF